MLKAVPRDHIETGHPLVEQKAKGSTVVRVALINIMSPKLGAVILGCLAADVAIAHIYVLITVVIKVQRRAPPAPTSAGNQAIMRRLCHAARTITQPNGGYGLKDL